MTCIVDYPTKKAFRAAVQQHGGDVLMEDPSIFAPFCGRLGDYMATRKSATFTNHPKRSWFAQVDFDSGNVLRVR